jgi:hypothetical protein
VELQNANLQLHVFAIRKSGFQEQLLNLNKMLACSYLRRTCCLRVQAPPVLVIRCLFGFVARLWCDRCSSMPHRKERFRAAMP